MAQINKELVEKFRDIWLAMYGYEISAAEAESQLNDLAAVLHETRRQQAEQQYDKSA